MGEKCRKSRLNFLMMEDSLDNSYMQQALIIQCHLQVLTCHLLLSETVVVKGEVRKL